MRTTLLALAAPALASLPFLQSTAPLTGQTRVQPRPAATTPGLIGDPRTPIGPLTTPGDADSLFRIAAPGSYYLTDNLAGVAGKAGIEIAANDVHVDLLGFSLTGVFNSLDGIRADQANRRGIVVRDGSIHGWTGDGLDLDGSRSAIVSDVIAFGNTGAGIRAGELSILERCVARGNDGGGIRVGDASLLRHCSAFSNSLGFFTGSTCELRSCTADSNLGDGIRVGARSLVEGCTSSRSSNGNGIVAGVRSSILDCTAADNFRRGVDIQSGLVRGCHLTKNLAGGILTADDSQIVGNLIAQCGGRGIEASGPRVRIEENHVTLSAGAGIRSVQGQCFIVRNTCIDNDPDFDVSGSTFLGVVLGLGVSPGSSDAAWANFVR